MSTPERETKGVVFVNNIPIIQPQYPIYTDEKMVQKFFRFPDKKEHKSSAGLKIHMHSHVYPLPHTQLNSNATIQG